MIAETPPTSDRRTAVIVGTLYIVAMPLIGAFMFSVFARASTDMARARFLFRSLAGVILRRHMRR